MVIRNAGAFFRKHSRFDARAREHILRSPLPTYAARADDLACLVAGLNRRGYSKFARMEMARRWEDKERQAAARDLVLSTVIPTLYTARLKLSSDLAEHEATKYARAETWDPLVRCAVDRIAAYNPDELLWIRQAVAISRFPNIEVLRVAMAVGRCIAKEFSALTPEARGILLDVGSVRHESRSQDLYADTNELFRILSNPELVSPQKFLRALEVISSPLGNIMNAYGDPKNGGKAENKKFAQFLKNCKDPSLKRLAKELDIFLQKNLMASSFNFFIPHIRAEGSAYQHVKWFNEATWHDMVNDHLRKGGKVPEEGYRTRIQAIEMCDQTGEYPKIPNGFIRDGLIVDKSTLTKDLHRNMHSPHFFNASGTTGNLMQFTFALLKKHKQLGLINNPTMTSKYAMLVAGAQFVKNGFHSWHEVTQAVRYINSILHKEDYIHPTASQVVADVKDFVIGIVEPTSTIAYKVANVAKITAENQLELDRLAKEHDAQLLQEMENKQRSKP